ncbi:MAG: DUF2378 family protein [Polyangiaceae bacterium]|nr:DUF2378 family protein [Polyangiaceae bacterium]
MHTTMQRNAGWGTRPISLGDAEDFARGLSIAENDRVGVARALYEFQPDGMARGIYFSALRAAVSDAIGESKARELQIAHGLSDRFIPFSLYPHRDLYRLWFAAIPQTHPSRPIAYGIERIAERYFPAFLGSTAGRTMAVLLGSDPLTIVKRLREAYTVSVPHNDHKLDIIEDGLVRWRATVEPSPWYSEAFIGILRGAMDGQGAAMPKVTTTKAGSVGRHHQRLVFELDWR